ncbi:MAG TPA: hypothetical protein VJC16_04730 [Candidatus Nanoarchaeia archaeon]|nr:hypothetical protein [Candidatus Nanoarchaeia archaeon]
MGAETYLKAFFTVMPKRFKLIGDLRNEKRRIEGLLINKGKTDAKDKIVQYCDELTQLIGKDTLFRKAERRNKYTLRHLTWKLAHSIEWYLKRSTLEIVVRSVRRQIKSQPFRSRTAIIENITNIQEYLFDVLPHIQNVLMNLDNVYQNEIALLKKISQGEIRTLEYSKLMDAEKNICVKSEPLFLDIEARNRSFANAVDKFKVEFKRIMATKGLTRFEREFIDNIGGLLGIIAVGLMLLNGPMYSVFDNDNSVWEIVGAVAGVCLTLLSALVAYGVISRGLAALQKTARFVSKNMI